ncbi:MAG: zinc-ribbon domain-containing protein [Candidatus Nanoarchaeia archaeon]|nr:zinc-ribbon domain-containing protein [Candidatus Nanoarchaeia archaeon]
MQYKKICMKCGAELKEEDKVCPKCKAKYREEQEIY